MKQQSLVFKSFPLFFLQYILLISCTHDPNLDGIDPVCFDTQVLPMLQISCAISGCHDGSQEGFLATDYNSVMLSVNAGDPRGSTLYKVITAINSDNMMPPDRPLTQLQRNIIQVWIAQGADNTKCDTSGTGGELKSCSDSTYFVQEILPLFVSGCAYPNEIGNCHDGILQGGEDDLYTLNSYTSIRQHVSPKNLNGSSVYQAVIGRGDEFMPPQPFAPLTSTEIGLLRKWINEGAVNNSCAEAGCADTLLTPIVYNDMISNIIGTNCKNCHRTGNLGGGINLETYQLVKQYAETIKTGTTNNYLVGTIRHLSGFVAMPYKSSPISECSIRKIELWIKDGKLEN